MTSSLGIEKNTQNSDLLLIFRGLAAVSVVIWHAEGYLGSYPFWLNVPGRTSVWLFFGISGYVIAYGFLHRTYSVSLASLKHFYLNRLLRIYPVFLLLTIVAWLTKYFAADENPIQISDIPAQLFAVQFNQEYLLNGVFWTLGIEIHFYILAPLLVLPLLGKEKQKSIIISVFIYIAIIVWIVFSYLNLKWSLDGRNIIACLPHFLSGMIGCKLVMSLSKNWNRFWASLIGVVFLIISTSFIYHNYPKYYWTPIGIVMVDLVILLLVVAHASWPGSDSIVISIFTKIGVLSYGIYAWHGFWMNMMPDMFLGNVFSLLVTSFVCAYLSYSYIELPALKFKRK